MADLDLIFKIEEGIVFKRFVSAFSAKFDEIRIRASKKGIHIVCMDPSKTSLADISIPPSSFTDYKCSASMFMDLSLEDLHKMTETCKPQESITVKHAKNGNKIDVIFSPQEEGNSRPRRFSLVLLSEQSDLEPKKKGTESILQKIVWEADVPPDDLGRIIKNAEIVSDIIQIHFNDSGVTFSSDGDIGDYEEQISSDDVSMEHKKDDVDESDGEYAVDSLKNLLKMGMESVDDTIKIGNATGNPFAMQINVLNGGNVKYFLAPKGPEDEDEEDEDDEDDLDESVLQEE